MKVQLLEYFRSFLLRVPPYTSDPDFEQAKQEFQSLLTAMELPDGVWDG